MKVIKNYLWTSVLRIRIPISKSMEKNQSQIRSQKRRPINSQIKKAERETYSESDPKPDLEMIYQGAFYESDPEPEADLGGSQNRRRIRNHIQHRNQNQS